MTQPQRTKPPMTAEDFVAWSEAHGDGERYELLDGEIIAMASERAVHARMKNAAMRQIERAIEAAGLPCEAFPDGMAVRIDDQTVFEPDCLVRCGNRVPPDTILILDPIIVVEVASPSTQRIDVLTKFKRYFENPSIQHYIIVVPTGRTLIHHTRRADGSIETIGHDGGFIKIDPPGLTLDFDALFLSVE